MGRKRVIILASILLSFLSAAEGTVFELSEEKKDEVKIEGKSENIITVPAAEIDLKGELTVNAEEEKTLEPEKEKFFEKYFFVGFSEIYSGINKNNGDTEIIEDATEYKEHYTKGRINLYLKGKIKGKYLLTAWLDTDENELKNLFKGLAERDRNSIFEKIDAEKYYPIYGDDSNRVNDVATSGKLYVALESESFKALWGNYSVNFNDNELVSFGKKLYGTNAEYSNNNTKTEAFVYKPYSASSIDTIKSTGGMLYYLKHDDLIIDSEIIKVELRDSSTGRVLSTATLNQGDDYEVSYSTGRVVLKDNISSYFSDSLIKGAKGYDAYYIVATYEYEASVDEGDASYGIESTVKISENNSLSVDYIKNTQDSSKKYQTYGVDWKYDNNKSKIEVGYAKSKNQISENYVSDDGGLNYTQQIISGSDDNSDAFHLKAEQKIGENKEISAYYTYKEKGFSTGNSIIDKDTTLFGAEINGKIKETKTKASYDKKNTPDKETDIYEFSTSKQKTEKLVLKSELEYEKDKYKTKNESDTDFIAAVGAEYALKDNVNVYGSQQITLDSSDNDKRNLTKLGTEIRENQWKFTAEGGLGNKESSLSLGTGYKLNKYSEIYTSHEKKIDKEDGTESANTIGAKSSLNKKTDVYTEYKVGTAGSKNTQSNVVGVDYYPTDKWALSVDYTKSDVDGGGGTTTDRDIVTTGVSYKGKKLKQKVKAEYREDKGSTPLSQKVLTTAIEWKQNEEIRYIADADYDRTVESGNETKKHVEAEMGMAYRPIYNDRLNLLSKYTYFEKTDAKADEDEYKGEKANVFAVEGIYDLSRNWQVGQKIGYKKARVRLIGNENTWYDSNTWMYIAKLNYKIVATVDISCEYKYLQNNLAKDKKDGIQLGVYKRFENNLKMGIGYNFASFNDDLTNLDYKSQGMFFNLIKAW